jgi:hypothetical protein
MTRAIQHVVISKWLPILQEYELVKAGQSAHFRTVTEIRKSGDSH